MFKSLSLVRMKLWLEFTEFFHYFSNIYCRRITFSHLQQCLETIEIHSIINNYALLELCIKSIHSGKEMVDYIADYLENIRERRVFPDVKPGYLREMLPDQAPHHGEDFDTIFSDIERCIMPGVTHWQSPYMHAYFPALNSYPSLLGDMLADGINCLGFTWASSPACTELESLVMDWLGQAIGLPAEFLHKTPVS